MKSISLLLCAALCWLASPRARAQEEANALLEVAAEKRAALLSFSVSTEAIAGTPADAGSVGGAFISEDGLALVGILALGSQTVEATTADGTVLDEGVLLGVLPEQSVAVFQFDHSPKAWLTLSPDAPEVGEDIALLTGGSDGEAEADTEPVIGPVMALRSTVSTRLKAPVFCRCLSLGSGVSAAQRGQLRGGVPAIDAEGHLVGLFLEADPRNEQVMLLVASLAGVGESIEALVEADEPMPFPLPEDENPLDLAPLDDGWQMMMRAMAKGDPQQAGDILREVLERHPDSLALKVMAAKSGLTGTDDPLGALEGWPEPEADDIPARQAVVRDARARLMLDANDSEAAIREFTAAVEVSPEDYALPVYSLGIVNFLLERFEEAARHFQQAEAHWPEFIQLVESLEQVSIRNREFQEAVTWARRANELRAIYKAP